MMPETRAGLDLAIGPDRTEFVVLDESHVWTRPLFDPADIARVFRIPPSLISTSRGIVPAWLGRVRYYAAERYRFAAHPRRRAVSRVARQERTRRRCPLTWPHGGTPPSVLK